jgi:hypothetical protein
MLWDKVRGFYVIARRGTPKQSPCGKVEIAQPVASEAKQSSTLLATTSSDCRATLAMTIYCMENMNIVLNV